MSELLPIVFVRGQNEGIDPRVAPPDVHAVARNVRWRKDGRPAKRYGVSAVTTTGLATYNAQPVNALTSWNRTPVIAVGSTVRQLGAAGWNLPASGVLLPIGDIAKFGPGEHDIIARDETAVLDNATSGNAQGVTLHAWQTGSGIAYAAKARDGTVLLTPRVIAGLTASYPRCVSTTNFVYLLTRNGTDIRILTFDPIALTLTFGGSAGTLATATSSFDAVGRGADFVIAFQSGPGDLTVRLFSAVASPVQLQNQTSVGAIAANTKLGIGSAPGAAIFVPGVEPLGAVKFIVYNTGLTVGLGGGVIEVDANNNAQPGVTIIDPLTADIVWGGFITATETSYMRATRVASTAVGPGINGIGTFYGVSPASKPFVGPAFTPSGVNVGDGPYVWVHTSNADNGSRKWDAQRGYYLMRYEPSGNPVVGWLSRHLHVPGVPPSATSHFHLSDILDLGGGFGYLVPLLNAVRYGNGITPALGFDTVTFHSIFASLRTAARDTVTTGRVLQFSGGSLFELNGQAEETGFSNYPVIHSIAGGGGGGGGLTNGSQYLYRAVYEWLDHQGRRHRSAASAPYLFANGASNSAQITIKPLIASSRGDKSMGFVSPVGVVVHIYRSLAGQSTYHRVTPNTGAPGAWNVGATILYLDSMPDTVAGAQEFIYTDGGVADNTLCPPHTFSTVCNGRLWVGGQLDRCVVTASKLLVDGEPTQFSDLDQFNSFLPEKNTGIASIDGVVVLFARERIYFINGDGPNDQGVGDFAPPSELPTDIGCTDWRSVAESSVGVFFQGKRGIYLLPRGFNTPQFVGLEVESTLAAYPIITSATVVAVPSNDAATLGETTVRFVACANESGTPSCVLVYDLRTGGWSVDELADGPKLGGTWLDAFITARTAAGVLTLHSESAAGTGYANYAGAFLPTTLGTGDIRPFGIAGYGSFASVVLVGEYRGPCQVSVQISVDGAVSDTFTFPVTGPDGPADNSVYLDVTPRIRLGAALRVTCADAGNPAAPSEGFIMQGLFIEHDTIGKTKRLAAARRA